MLRNWSGVGGVGGMIIFLALAHMLDATQLVRGGWGGMTTFLALAHMLDATQLVRGGWGGMITFLALAHMLDATQVVKDFEFRFCQCHYENCSFHRWQSRMAVRVQSTRSATPACGSSVEAVYW